MRTLFASLVALLALIALSPAGQAHAQSPVGDTGSAGVTKGRTAIESRLAGVDDGEWRWRTHWDHGFTQRYGLRVIAEQGRTDAEGWQHRSLTFENRFDFTPAEGDYSFGARVAYVVSARDSADEIDLRLIGSRAFGDGWEYRGNVIFEFQVGAGAQAGAGLELRQQLTRDLDAFRAWGGDWTAGAELLSDIGALRKIEPLDTQGHVAGAYLSSRFQSGLGVRFGARAGLTDASDDLSVRLTVSQRF